MRGVAGGRAGGQSKKKKMKKNNVFFFFFFLGSPDLLEHAHASVFTGKHFLTPETTPFLPLGSHLGRPYWKQHGCYLLNGWTDFHWVFFILKL